MERRELFRRVATLAGAAAAVPALSAQAAPTEATSPALTPAPAIELKGVDAHGRSASLKLHGIDISNMCRGVIINANVDEAITAHVNIIALDGLDVVLPEASVQINVTVMPGWTLLVTEDEHGVKRFTAQRA